MKDDGTVEFEVPGDAEPHAFGGGPADVYPESVDEESLDATDLQYIPPLQIVMLIVGTRGDVQPFIAIGKKLQVEILFNCYMASLSWDVLTLNGWMSSISSMLVTFLDICWRPIDLVFT